MRRSFWSALMALCLVGVGCDGDESAGPQPEALPTTQTTEAVVPRTGPATGPRCAVPKPQPAKPDSTEIRVYFYCDGGDAVLTPIVPVTRQVPKTQAVLQAVIEALVRGPTAEEKAAGLVSGVPEEASRAPVRVTVENGVATIAIDYDLASVANFTTTNVTAWFLRALDTNTFQFDTVRSIDLTPICPSLTELKCEPLSRSVWEKNSAKPCPPPQPPGSLCVE
jgi:sporulation and spore germination protein